MLKWLMPKFRHLLQKLNKYLPFFASELVLILFAAAAVTSSVAIKANAKAGTPSGSRSLLFSYLEARPHRNPLLLDASATFAEKLGARPDLQKQVLAASVIAKAAAAPAEAGALSDAAILKPNPSGSGGMQKDIEVYEVRPGDTVARIAGAYGVSDYTIIAENGLPESGLIKPGQELRILPTSGVKHTVKDGETVAGIAKKYKVDMEDILEYNEIEIEEFILPGDELIIPGGSIAKPATPKRQQYLADLKKEDVQRAAVPGDFQGSGGGYLWPMPAASKLSQGFKRSHPGIDVPCKYCDVVAAADGIVELAGTQKGYGKTIVINHGGGRKTRYAHGSNLLVSAGESVTAGQSIMVSGNTGRSTGPHLHFEIIETGGRVNPLSKY